MSDPNIGIEIELGKAGRKFYLKVFFEPVQIWIDFQGLPELAFLCACHDGAPILTAKLVKVDEERLFVNMDWCLDFYKTDKKMFAALNKRRQMIIDDIPTYKDLIDKSNQEASASEAS